MSRLGVICYYLGRPLIRRLLARTRRAYVLVRHQGQILVVKPWLGRDDWGLPGGGLKKRESTTQAALRELKYETGLSLSPSDLTPLTKGRWQTDQLGFEYTIFQANLPSSARITIRRPELVDARWLKLEKLKASNCPAEILAALKR